MLDARLTALRESMSARRLDALLVTNIDNIFYLSGFAGSTAVLLVTADKCCILVDPRYTIQARAECALAEVREYSGKTGTAAAAELVSELSPKSLGYEAAHVSVTTYRELRKLVGRSTGLRATDSLVETLRMVKDAEEIRTIQTASGMADATFDSVIREIRPGMTEREVAALVDITMRRMGADESAFPTIAAAGPNAAKPHATPSDNVVERGHMLKLDFGARYKRYSSDLTRTIFVGKPNAQYRKVYAAALDAQLAAIDAIRPGVLGADVDAVARDLIASKGYGDSFTHGLGHMIGIAVHDGPAFSSTSKVILKPGMVASVEPGIYIQDWGGVRIEDDILVTDSGAEVLTRAPKELICI